MTKSISYPNCDNTQECTPSPYGTYSKEIDHSKAQQRGNCHYLVLSDLVTKNGNVMFEFLKIAQ